MFGFVGVAALQRRARPDSLSAARIAESTRSTPRRRVRMARATVESSPAWTPSSWQNIAQADAAQMDEIGKRMAICPSLVYSGEVDRLQKMLLKVSTGDAFLLMAGTDHDTAGENDANAIESTFRLLVAQVIILAFHSGLPVVKVGHIAGHFEGYRLEQLHQHSVDVAMALTSYFRASATLNLLRAVAKSTTSMLDWADLILEVAEGVHADFLGRVEDALCFVRACGLDVNDETFREPEFYAAHELFLLPYEQALARQHDDKWYSTSAHMFWVQEGSERLGHAHVEFLRGISNPIAIRIGPQTSVNDLFNLLDVINPNNEPGRVVLAAGLGASAVWTKLPPMIRSVKESGRNVIWICDPMRQNTIPTENGCLTCPMQLILAEVASFFAINVQEDTIPGGVSLDMVGADVNECVGGELSIRDSDILCESPLNASPRLNPAQALEIAFDIGQRLRRMQRPGDRLRSR